MAYKFLNFEPDNAFDDEIEAELNRHEARGWQVVDVKWYGSGHVKVLMHQDGS